MKLTVREKQVLAGLIEGKTDKEIARDISLGHGTVRNIIHVLCGKFDATNRTVVAVKYDRMNRPDETG